MACHSLTVSKCQKKYLFAWFTAHRKIPLLMLLLKSVFLLASPFMGYFMGCPDTSYNFGSFWFTQCLHCDWTNLGEGWVGTAQNFSSYVASFWYMLNSEFCVYFCNVYLCSEPPDSVVEHRLKQSLLTETCKIVLVAESVVIFRSSCLLSWTVIFIFNTTEAKKIGRLFASLLKDL